MVSADYLSFSLIVTGDAETVADSAILRSGLRLRATVLQLGHHGSSSASSIAFRHAVSPELAVYYVAAGNS